jgi:hypothetical protein
MELHKIIFIAGVVFCLFVLPFCKSGSNTGTDGVYESATKKMDEGIPLNDREKRRIDDILDYKDKARANEIEHQNGE